MIPVRETVANDRWFNNWKGWGSPEDNRLVAQGDDSEILRRVEWEHKRRGEESVELLLMVRFRREE
jgi:hypothetical protein